MTDDVFAPYRLDQPLTQDEEVLVQIGAVKEHLAQGGVTVQRREDGCYLVFSEMGGNREELVVGMMTIDRQLQEATEAPQQWQRSASAWRLALRLALASWGERDPITLSCLSRLAGCLYALGRATEALPLYQQALVLFGEALGGRHPNTLQSLNNLAVCLYSLGRSAEALPLLQQALALCREVLGERHPDTLQSLNNLASCLRVLGRSAEALPLHQQALTLCREALGGRHPNTLQSLNSLAVCLYSLGRSAEALPLLQQALALRREVLGERHPDTLQSLNNLAGSLQTLGRSTEALPLYQQALVLFREVRGERHPDTLRSLDSLAGCLGDLGRRAEALPLCEQVLAGFREVLGERHPDTLRSFNNLAGYFHRLGFSHKALPLYQQALAGQRKVLGENHPDTLHSLDDLACCLDELHQVDRSDLLPVFVKVIVWRRDMLGERHPDTLESLHHLATCLNRIGQEGYLNRAEEALAIWRELVDWLADRPLLTNKWPELVWQVAHVLAEAVQTGAAVDWDTFPLSRSKDLSEAVQTGAAVDWAGPFQDLSRAWVEVLDLQPPEQVAVLREPFQRFHRLYFALCLNQHRTDLIPKLLAALQGRQLAALLLEEMTQNLADEVAADAPLRQRVLALRRQLRQAALGLQVIEGGRDRRDEDGTLRSITADPPSIEARLAAARKQRAEYDDLYQQYHALLGQLRQSEPDFARAAPALDVDLPTLQAGLAAADALALLLHVRAADDANERVFVLLITARDHQLVPLPADLLTLPGHAWRRQEAISDRAGLRYTSTAGADAAAAPDAAPAPGDGPASLAAWAAAMNQHFWQPLAPALNGMRTVHLVSHGDFHVLPYAAGSPAELTVYTYPGLLFYHPRRHLGTGRPAGPPHPSAAAPLGLHGYTAADHPDHPTIPLVDAEVRLIADLWPEAVRTPLNLPPAEQVAFLHCAGHGQHPTADPLSAGLVLGPNTLLDCRALFRGALRPQVVFLSACVVGRTREDRDGEPLGLVSVFLLRGAAYVVAPLQPVSDCLMPLLAGLFHQAWRAGLAPPQALLEAKRRLAGGDWYPDTADRVRAAYAATLESYLPALLAEPDRKRQGQGLRALRRWPLPPAYAQAGEAGLRAQLATDRGRQSFIADFLAHLERNRRALPVAELLPWVVGFGGPAG